MKKDFSDFSSLSSDVALHSILSRSACEIPMHSERAHGFDMPLNETICRRSIVLMLIVVHVSNVLLSTFYVEIVWLMRTEKHMRE
jgi:hypothetical protein